MNLSFSRQKSRSLRLTRVMRCLVGLEPDVPAPLEREGHVPDPCKMQTSRRERDRGEGRGGVVFVFKTIAQQQMLP